MKKYISIILSFVLVMSVFSGCQTGHGDDGKLNIVASVFPIYDWVSNITDGADDVNLSMLVRNGTDLHSYQPSAADLITISECDVFIYVGGESDDWATDTISRYAKKDCVVINLLEVLGNGAKKEEIQEGMEEPSGDGDDDEYDEHVWLSISNAITFTEKIAAELEKKDTENSEKYAANTAAYVNELLKLDLEFCNMVNNAAVKTLLFADRFPFRYLLDDYGIAYYAAFAGCSAETEASFSTITFLAGKVDELGLPAVIVIDGSDTKLAKTVVSNTNNKALPILTLDSMQTVSSVDAKKGITYISIMQKNLEVLRSALKSEAAPEPTGMPEATDTPAPTATTAPTGTLEPSATPAATPTESAAATATPTAAANPTATAMPTAEPTGAGEATSTPTPAVETTGTATPTPEAATAAPTATAKPTATPTAAAKPTATSAPTNTTAPTGTAAPTNTASPTNTPVPTNTTAPTNTPVPTNTTAPTNTPVPTNTTAPTNTPVPTSTPTPAVAAFVWTDKTLENAVRSAIGKPSGTISETDIQSITSLDLRCKGLTSVADLAKFTGLKTLYLDDNSISDISALASLTKLEKLTIGYNSISNISAVAKLTNLTCLCLNNNQISDISAVSSLKKIQELNLEYNSITAITALSGLNSLKILRLTGNKISSITALSGIVSGIDSLWLGFNNITGISALSGLKASATLNLADNDVVDWSPVAHVKNVTGRP